MNKPIYLFFFVSLFAGNMLCAQTDSAATKIEFMYVALGFNFSALSYTDAASMRKLAKKQSGALLNENLSPYFSASNANYAGEVSEVSPDLAAGLGVRLWNKKRGVFRKSTLRLSMRYSEFSPLRTYYAVDSNSYAGTYYNTNNSFQPIVINEVKHSSYSIKYHVSVIQAEVAQYFHTNEARRVSVYGGYALQLGATVFSRLEVSKGYHTGYEEQKPGNQQTSLSFYKNLDSDYEYARYKAKGAIAAGAGLVTGIQLRLSKKDNAFGGITYAMEIRPGINTFLVPNNGTPLTPAISWTSIIRYRF
jgi:hypothetical protein